MIETLYMKLNHQSTNCLHTNEWEIKRVNEINKLLFQIGKRMCQTKTMCHSELNDSLVAYTLARWINKEGDLIKYLDKSFHCVVNSWYDNIFFFNYIQIGWIISSSSRINAINKVLTTCTFYVFFSLKKNIYRIEFTSFRWTNTQYNSNNWKGCAARMCCR